MQQHALGKAPLLFSALPSGGLPPVPVAVATFSALLSMVAPPPAAGFYAPPTAPTVVAVPFTLPTALPTRAPMPAPPAAVLLSAPTMAPVAAALIPSSPAVAQAMVDSFMPLPALGGSNVPPVVALIPAPSSMTAFPAPEFVADFCFMVSSLGTSGQPTFL
ncbi:unnamed protein product [Coccothraustes coccothraustes]